MSVYNPLTYFNIGELYLANPFLIDAIIFFIIFTSLCVGVFKRLKQFDGKGKYIGVALGAFLTFSLSVLQVRTGFHLGMSEVTLLPAIILGSLFYVLLYTLIHDITENFQCAGSIAFLVTYMVIDGIFFVLFDELRARYLAFDTLMTLIVFVAVILLIMCIVSLFKGSGGNDGDDDDDDSLTIPFRRGRGNGGDDDDDDSSTTPPQQIPNSLQTLIQAFIRSVGDLAGTPANPGLYGRVQATATTLLSNPQDSAAATAFANAFVGFANALQALVYVQQQIANHPQLNTLTGPLLQSYLASVQTLVGTTNGMYALWQHFQLNYTP